MDKIVEPLSPIPPAAPNNEPTVIQNQIANTTDPPATVINPENNPGVVMPAPSAQITPVVPAPTNNPGLVTGVAASQMGWNSKGDTLNRTALFKKLIIILAVLLIITGLGLFIKSTFTGLGTKTLTSGDYTYSFKFFKSANQVQLSDGSFAYKYHDVIGGIRPSNAPALTKCTQIGSQWTEAFRVNVYGTDTPVCSPNKSAYTMYFSALDHRHLFSVTYKDPQTSEIYPTLKTIFESASVSK